MTERETIIRAEWGDALRPLDAAALEPWGFEEGTARFLTRVGLPAEATDGANINLAFSEAQDYGRFDVAGRDFVKVGETDTGAAVLVDPATGHVLAGDETGVMFANGSLEALLGCMAMYRREFVAHPLSWDEEGEPDDDERPGTPATRARADRLRARLNTLDPLALDERFQGDNVGLWGFVVEEVEAGVI